MNVTTKYASKNIKKLELSLTIETQRTVHTEHKGLGRWISVIILLLCSLKTLFYIQKWFGQLDA